MNEMQQFVAEQLNRIINDNHPFFKTLSNHDLLVSFTKENRKIKIALYQLSNCVSQNGIPIEVPDQPLLTLTRDIEDLEVYEDTVNDKTINKMSSKQIQAAYYILSLFRVATLISGVPLKKYEEINQRFTHEMEEALYVINSAESNIYDFQNSDSQLYRFKDFLVEYFATSLKEGKVSEHASWYHLLGMISTTCFQHSLIKAGLGEYRLSKSLIEYAAVLYPDKSENNYLSNCKNIWSSANEMIVQDDGSQLLYSSYNKIENIIEKQMTFEDYCHKAKELAGY